MSIFGGSEVMRQREVLCGIIEEFWFESIHLIGNIGLEGASGE